VKRLAKPLLCQDEEGAWCWESCRESHATESASGDLILEGPLCQVDRMIGPAEPERAPRRGRARRQILLFRVLLTIISAVIMALIIYTLTLEKLHPIALLKLIGAPNHTIVGLILQQSLIMGALAYGIGYLIGQRLFPLFPRRVLVTGDDLLRLAGIVLVISVVGSLLGIWKAMRVAPNEAIG
jgi:hypothetical protein